MRGRCVGMGEAVGKSGGLWDSSRPCLMHLSGPICQCTDIESNGASIPLFLSHTKLASHLRAGSVHLHGRDIGGLFAPIHLISSAPATNSHITTAHCRSSPQGIPTKSAEKIVLLIEYPATHHWGKIRPPSRQVSFCCSGYSKMYLVTCGVRWGVQTVIVFLFDFNF